MTQHTPGPWRADADGDVETSSGHFVVTAYYDPNKHANARLIAAAPDLLETACRALDLLEGLGVDSGIPGVANMLRDAIAKATGENLQETT